MFPINCIATVLGRTRLLFGAALFTALPIACTNHTPQTPTRLVGVVPNDTLLRTDAVLHSRLQAVLNADDAFAQAVNAAAASDVLDGKSAAIATAEIALQKTVDSLAQQPLNSSNRESLQRIVGYFRSILQSRRGLSDLRMVVSANSDDSSAMQQRLLQLRAELQEKTKADEAKDKKIHDLERTVGHMSSIGTEAENGAAAKVDSYAPSKGETLADLKQRNKNLYEAYSSLQSKYFIVGRNYLLLKQEHDRTVKELAALRQKAGSRQ